MRLHRGILMDLTTTGLRVNLLPQRGKLVCWAEVACSVAEFFKGSKQSICDLLVHFINGCASAACSTVYPITGVCDDVGDPEAGMAHLGLVVSPLANASFAGICGAIRNGHPCVITTQNQGKKVNHAKVVVGFVDATIGGKLFQGLEIVDSGSSGYRALYIEPLLSGLIASEMWSVIEAGPPMGSMQSQAERLTEWNSALLKDGKDCTSLPRAANGVQEVVSAFLATFEGMPDNLQALGELDLTITYFPGRGEGVAAARGLRTFLTDDKHTYAALDLFPVGEGWQVGRVLVGLWLEKLVGPVNRFAVAAARGEVRSTGILEWADLGLEVLVVGEAIGEEAAEAENPRVEPIGPRDFDLERPWAGERRFDTLVQEMNRSLKRSV
jgi:hypothetical protein